MGSHTVTLRSIRIFVLESGSSRSTLGRITFVGLVCTDIRVGPARLEPTQLLQVLLMILLEYLVRRRST